MSDERLTRLEEAQAFSERTVESLDGEVRALGDRIDALRRVVERLEGRIDGMEQASQADDLDDDVE